MPTETDPVPTTSPESVEIRSRSGTHASCPPEDIRDGHALLEDIIDDTRDTDELTRPEGARDVERVIIQQPTPEPESDANAIREDSPEISKASTADNAREDVSAMVVEPLSPVTSPNSGGSIDNEGRVQSQAIDVTLAQPCSPAPLYLNYGCSLQKECPSSITSFLRPGSKFKGTQQSDRQVYDVQVELKDVNMAESFLCGYLRIQGLTDDHPTLTTFFEGEIIGSKHLFRTTNPSWGSSEKTDMQHWARFAPWKTLAKSATSPNFTLKNAFAREHIFMRWKEYFLVPDHRVKTITGASFEGFYYICFNQTNGHVSGIYFHAKSEKYQQLELHHVDDGGCMGAVEFR